MYRLMYTRALLQSKDHSVGSKRYLSRLEKRVESFGGVSHPVILHFKMCFLFYCFPSIMVCHIKCSLLF